MQCRGGVKLNPITSAVGTPAGSGLWRVWLHYGNGVMIAVCLERDELRSIASRHSCAAESIRLRDWRGKTGCRALQ